MMTFVINVTQTAGFIFRRPSASRSGNATPTAPAAAAAHSHSQLYSRISNSSGISSSRAGLAGAFHDAAAAAAVQMPAKWQQQEQRWYYLLTYGLLAGMVLVAVAASNIWEVLSAVGDLASTIQVSDCI
jgi:hypothetical protein